MKTYAKVLGGVFILLGVIFAIAFAIPARIDPNPAVWFTPKYYSQFVPIAVSVMLLVSGAFLLLDHAKANFNLAVFGHAASEEALFHWIGLTSSSLPGWTLWVFFLLSVVTLVIAYTNVLEQKRLSVGEALFGIIFGAVLVLLPVIV